MINNDKSVNENTRKNYYYLLRINIKENAGLKDILEGAGDLKRRTETYSSWITTTHLERICEK